MNRDPSTRSMRASVLLLVLHIKFCSNASSRIRMAGVNSRDRFMSKEEPELSAKRIADHMADIYPIATPKQIRKVIGVKAGERKEPEKKEDRH